MTPLFVWEQQSETESPLLCRTLYGSSPDPGAAIPISVVVDTTGQSIHICLGVAGRAAKERPNAAAKWRDRWRRWMAAAR
jgi:hypothetical protein